jgi:hypothetical protein
MAIWVGEQRFNSMSEPKLENESGLIIEPGLLADIQAQCQRRRTELEAAGALPAATIAPESPQSVREALPAPSPPTPPLASAFWQALLYGSPDALVSPSEANTALRLVASELSTDLDVIEFTESIRGQHAARFGAGAWPAMNKVWRSALASPGAPRPSDHSQLSPGPLPVGRSQPRWIRELNESGGLEREWLIKKGLWCG